MLAAAASDFVMVAAQKILRESTPPECISSAEFDKLSAAVGGLMLTDTSKSRPGPKVGITGKRLGTQDFVSE